MTQSPPPAGWYPDPGNAQLQRWWDGSVWTDHTQPGAQVPPPPPQQQFAAAPAQTYAPVQRQFQITGYNQRMANRVARRAKLNEPGVAVAYTYNNLATMLIFGLVEEVAKLIPGIGEALDAGISLISFYFHRILIVTDRNVYVYRDLPFHLPGKQLAMYARGPGVVQMGDNSGGSFMRFVRRGELTFQDGTVVFHSPWWIRRSQYIAQEANIPPGQ